MYLDMLLYLTVYAPYFQRYRLQFSVLTVTVTVTVTVTGYSFQQRLVLLIAILSATHSYFTYY